MGLEFSERALDSAVRSLSEALGERAQLDAQLGSRTTYRVGGRASLYLEVDSCEDLRSVHAALASAGGAVPLLVVGQGSNLLVADGGFRGIALGLGGSFDWMEVLGEKVRAGAAVKFPVLARRSVEAGLRGLEWAVGVPGSVGGALKMNAGGHGSDTAAVLERYKVYDLATDEAAEHPATSLAFGYRRSALRPGEFVVWAEFGLGEGDIEEGRAMVSEIVRWRREHQPGGSNAGSVFTNPPSDSAGRLVEEAGLKGFRIGSAAVSDKHANFIQADEGGSADDVRRLIEHVRNEVARGCGEVLETEVRLIGFEDSPHLLVSASAALPSISTRGRGSRSRSGPASGSPSGSESDVPSKPSSELSSERPGHG
jgi:UDP-N-acetylmuramate dehydrogenase